MKTLILRPTGAIGALFALCIAGVAFAQYSQTAPAPQQASPEPRPASAPAKASEPAPKALAKAERAPARRASGKPLAQDPECAFTGRRIVGSLARDDVDAAQKFVRFYEMFSCPTEHLRDAFRCAVRGGAPAPGKPLSERVDECWDKAPIASTGR